MWNDFEMWYYSEFSIVLTKAAFMKTSYLRTYARGLPKEARAYIDERKNCEDIAMQLLVSAATGKPPVYVPVPFFHYLWAKWEGFGVAGISKSSTHHDTRGDCITDLSRIILDAGAPGRAADGGEGGVAEEAGELGNGRRVVGGLGETGHVAVLRRTGMSTPLVSAKLKAWEG